MKSSKSNTLTIIGAGVLGQHIAHYALQTNTFTSISFIDDTCPPNTLTEYGRVIGSIEQISQLIDLGAIKNLAIGIGYKHFELRTTIFEKYIKKIHFPNITHPKAYIDKSVSIGSGNVILPGCIIDKNTEIFNNVFLNPGCIIAHDCSLQSHSFFGPGVKTSGFVQIGESCFLGTGTTIIDNLSITRNTTIGAGSVITKNINLPGIYKGVPAKMK